MNCVTPCDGQAPVGRSAYVDAMLQPLRDASDAIAPFVNGEKDAWIRLCVLGTVDKYVLVVS